MDQVTADLRHLARMEHEIAVTRAAIERQIEAIRHLARQGLDTTVHKEVLEVFRMCETSQLNHRELLRSEIQNESACAELHNRAELAIAETRRILANTRKHGT
jgi:hypothetical protein